MHEVEVLLERTIVECVGPWYICLASDAFDFLLGPWFPALVPDADDRWWERRSTFTEETIRLQYTREELRSIFEEQAVLAWNILYAALAVALACFLLNRYRHAKNVSDLLTSTMYTSLGVAILDFALVCRTTPDGPRYEHNVRSTSNIFVTQVAFAVVSFLYLFYTRSARAST